MGDKQNNKSNSKWYWNWVSKNIYLAVIVLFVVIYLIFLLLDFITRHNEEFEVPSFAGLTFKEAQKVAKDNNLRLEITDSVYMPRLPLGVIYKQNPTSKSKVKQNRRVLLTINSTTPKMVSMPNVVGLSLRQAQSELASNQLKVRKLIYKEDIATNNVLGQQYKGRDIKSNEKVPVETEIDLVLGLNVENNKTYVPNVLGKPYLVIKDFLIDNSLNIGKVIYDSSVKNYTDSLNAVAYKQEPVASVDYAILLGSQVNVYLTLDSKKLPKVKNVKEEE